MKGESSEFEWDDIIVVVVGMEMEGDFNLLEIVGTVDAFGGVLSLAEGRQEQPLPEWQ